MKVYVIKHKDEWEINHNTLYIYTNKEEAMSSLDNNGVSEESNSIDEVELSEIYKFLKRRNGVCVIAKGNYDETKLVRNLVDKMIRNSRGRIYEGLYNKI